MVSAGFHESFFVDCFRRRLTDSWKHRRRNAKRPDDGKVKNRLGTPRHQVDLASRDYSLSALQILNDTKAEGNVFQPKNCQLILSSEAAGSGIPEPAFHRATHVYREDHYCSRERFVSVSEIPRLTESELNEEKSKSISSVNLAISVDAKL